MPVTQPMSLKDFFKTIGNSFTVPPITPNSAGGAGPGFTSRTQDLPNGAGSYQSPVPNMSMVPSTPNMSMAPLGPVKPPTTPLPTAPTGGNTPPPTGNRVFTGGGNAPAPAGGTAPAAPTAPVDYTKYSKYINPTTGGFYSPEEFTKMMETKAGAGVVPTYAQDQILNPGQTTEELTRTARDLNNTRNDIAVGEKDPYGLATSMKWSPAEMDAIRKAGAGVFDPALNDVFTKLEARQKEDAKKEADRLAEEKAGRDLENDLRKMAIQFEYDKKLKSIGGSGGTGGNQQTDNERAAQTLFQNNPIVKDYNTVVSQKNAIDRIILNGVGGPADVNAIFSFMKALDPNSVVRESEYDKAAASGNLFQGIFTKFNGYFKDKGGFLPENVQQEFQNLIGQKLSAQAASYNNVAQRTREIAARQKLNPDNVVIDFSGGIENLIPQIVTAPDGATIEITD